MEIEHFINVGYGWMCKHCASRAEEAGAVNAEGRARFFTEGEAESKEPLLSTPALARWRDATRRTLYCPNCGVEENVSKA
jgi:hypothetical protein